ncbi:hypothetical protein JTE90_029157 [Oedothorax gibbosus]|uniref:Uncharacterized protein n=1 Tax=Oedothorax gibbosus TaxID=931172 RepID=A0AAV6THI2_9ARAC|nr:hypothetical protein JTE90_029157 [Oedothorax gibbosus]
MVVTGDGESGFDSEREPEKRLPIKEGSRRAKLPTPGTGAIINVEGKAKVQAAAVTLAPIAYSSKLLRLKSVVGFSYSRAVRLTAVTARAEQDTRPRFPDDLPGVSLPASLLE